MSVTGIILSGYIEQVYLEFEDSEPLQAARRMLDEGLISQLEFAQYVLGAWEEHKRLPQHRDVTSAFPLEF